jgi:hypothetical protein
MMNKNKKAHRYSLNFIAITGLILLNVLGSVGGGIATALLTDLKGTKAAQNLAKYTLIQEARQLKVKEVTNARKRFEDANKAFKKANASIRSGKNRDADMLSLKGPYVKGKTAVMAYRHLPYLDQPLEVKVATSQEEFLAKEKELESFDAESLKDEISFVESNLPEKFTSSFETEENGTVRLRNLSDVLIATTTSFNSNFLQGKWSEIMGDIGVLFFSIITSTVSIFWLIYFIKSADVEETFNPIDQYKYDWVHRCWMAEEFEKQIAKEQEEENG